MINYFLYITTALFLSACSFHPQENHTPFSSRLFLQEGEVFEMEIPREKDMNLWLK